MEVAVSGATGYYVYGSIKAETLRNFIDNLFPSLAKNLDADYISGAYHRYKGGHDLFIDVPKTFIEKGFSNALKHAGHILLTDFPTKSGIPIPGFSHIGLGRILEDFGISKGWLNINIMDGGIGFLAIDEGHVDLLNALSGTLNMNTFNFFDTYVEGGVELLLAINFQNPFLLGGAIENIISGIISTIKTYTIYVNPLDFFGAGITSALIGGTFSYLISKGNKEYINILKSSIKSASIGAMFKVFTPFAFGLIAGYSLYEIGKYMAIDSNSKQNEAFYISYKDFEKIFESLSNVSSEDFIYMWKDMNNVRKITISEDLLITLEEEIFNLKLVRIKPDVKYFKENKLLYFV